MPPSEITPTSVVPPPMSTTIEPVASATGRPAPIAAAIGSSIRYTWRGAGAERRFADRAALDLGRAAGHADDDARAGREQPRVVHLLDELLEHLLGDGEVGDHAVLHRADGGDVARRLAEHLLGRHADRLDRLLGVGPAFGANGDHRGLVQHDALAAHVDQGVGGAEVDRQIVGEVGAQETEHRVLRLGSPREGWGEKGKRL